MVKIYKHYIRTFSLFPLISTNTVLQGSIDDPFPITVLSTISVTPVYAWNGCDRSVNTTYTGSANRASLPTREHSGTIAIPAVTIVDRNKQATK